MNSRLEFWGLYSLGAPPWTPIPIFLLWIDFFYIGKNSKTKNHSPAKRTDGSSPGVASRTTSWQSRRTRSAASAAAGAWRSPPRPTRSPSRGPRPSESQSSSVRLPERVQKSRTQFTKLKLHFCRSTLFFEVTWCSATAFKKYPIIRMEFYQALERQICPWFQASHIKSNSRHFTPGIGIAIMKWSLIEWGKLKAKVIWTVVLLICWSEVQSTQVEIYWRKNIARAP